MDAFRGDIFFCEILDKKFSEIKNTDEKGYSQFIFFSVQ